MSTGFSNDAWAFNHALEAAAAAAMREHGFAVVATTPDSRQQISRICAAARRREPPVTIRQIPIIESYLLGYYDREAALLQVSFTYTPTDASEIAIERAVTAYVDLEARIQTEFREAEVRRRAAEQSRTVIIEDRARQYFLGILRAEVYQQIQAGRNRHPVSTEVYRVIYNETAAVCASRPDGFDLPNDVLVREYFELLPDEAISRMASRFQQFYAQARHFVADDDREADNSAAAEAAEDVGYESSVDAATPPIPVSAMPESQRRQLNAQLFAMLDDPATQREAADLVNDWTRQQMRRQPYRPITAVANTQLLADEEVPLAANRQSFVAAYGVARDGHHAWIEFEHLARNSRELRQFVLLQLVPRPDGLGVVRTEVIRYVCGAEEALQIFQVINASPTVTPTATDGRRSIDLG